MAETYTYQVELFEGDRWHTSITAEDHSVAGRSGADIARAILEDWIIDHPQDLAGGGRVSVFGDDPSEYPPDALVRVRVRVFRGGLEVHEPEPAAVAYLLADSGMDDPHGWVNP
ncbi:hypothetical protein [Actinopolymorpha alba]|uniref:hypothetical protein n=1 Tax=Actinopolymorpha alba TaxID=533267 RepID=UPI0003818CCC|nr:hypothetical protein [Actinopolymorpha alba]